MSMSQKQTLSLYTCAREALSKHELYDPGSKSKPSFNFLLWKLRAPIFDFGMESYDRYVSTVHCHPSVLFLLGRYREVVVRTPSYVQC